MVDDAVKAILAADDYRIERLMASDVEALDKLMTADFTYTHNAGFTDNKAEYLARIASGGVTYTAGERIKHETRHHGDTGIMSGHLRMVANLPDQAIQLDNLFLAIWVLNAGVWQIAAWSSTTRGA